MTIFEAFLIIYFLAFFLFGIFVEYLYRECYIKMTKQYSDLSYRKFSKIINGVCDSRDQVEIKKCVNEKCKLFVFLSNKVRKPLSIILLILIVVWISN